MSIIEVQVPQLSESVAEGTLASWKKKIGETVARDEILIDIETDKVVLEVPSPGAGVLVEIVKGDGETVVSGELIARIDTAATAGAAAPAAAAAPKAAAPRRARLAKSRLACRMWSRPICRLTTPRTVPARVSWHLRQSRPMKFWLAGMGTMARYTSCPVSSSTPEWGRP